MSHVYVERADPDTKGYETGTRRHYNVVDRYRWANTYVYGTVIDMPCGMGWGASYITKADMVVGIDYCHEALEKGKKLYPYIKFIQADITATPFKNHFADSIICCEGYEHLCRRDQFYLMWEIYRLIKPDGIVLMTIPIVRQKGEHSGNQFHLYEPTFDEVEETFYGYFTIISKFKPNVARYVLRPIK